MCPTQRCERWQIWMTHNICVALCSRCISQRQFRSFWGSLHKLLTLPQLGIAFHSPPVEATEFYLWVKMVYLPCDGFPSSWCQVRIPWFVTTFQNLQITLWLVGSDGFCQKHETLYVACHKYFTIADLLDGVCRPAAKASNSAVRATTSHYRDKIPMLLNDSPFYYSFLWDFAIK